MFFSNPLVPRLCGSSLARSEHFICEKASRLVCGRSVVCLCNTCEFPGGRGVYLHLRLAGRRAMTAYCRSDVKPNINKHSHMVFGLTMQEKTYTLFKYVL